MLKRLLMALACVLASLLISGCSRTPDHDWALVQQRAKTWKPVLARKPLASYPMASRADPFRARTTISTFPLTPGFDKRVSVRQKATDGEGRHESGTGEFRLQTPNTDFVEARQEEARNQAREREIDRVIKFGICRGC